MKNYKRGNSALIIFLIVLVLAAAATWYLSQNSPNPSRTDLDVKPPVTTAPPGFIPPTTPPPTTTELVQLIHVQFYSIDTKTGLITARYDNPWKSLIIKTTPKTLFYGDAGSDPRRYATYEQFSKDLSSGQFPLEFGPGFTVKGFWDGDGGERWIEASEISWAII